MTGIWESTAASRSYTWFYDAQAAGKHVYLIASHSHFYSPNIFNTAYWKQHESSVVPGWIIGTAGAHRYALPRGVDKGSRTHIYGYLQGPSTPMAPSTLRCMS